MQTIKQILLTIGALVSAIVTFLFVTRRNKKANEVIQNDNAAATQASTLQDEISALKDEIEVIKPQDLSPEEITEYWKKRLH
jgi:gas vesicle protein